MLIASCSLNLIRQNDDIINDTISFQNIGSNVNGFICTHFPFRIKTLFINEFDLIFKKERKIQNIKCNDNVTTGKIIGNPALQI